MTLTLQHSAMMRRTLQIYRHMEKRFAEKRYKTGKRAGKVFRDGREIPFTLEEFRVRVVTSIGIGRGCTWCRAFITINNFVTDHDTPVQRGGSLGLDNIRFICADCNNVKGDLTGEEYNRLRQGLFGMGSYIEKSVLRRLRMGAMGMRLRHFGRKPAIQEEHDARF